jgi:DNA polymerase-3 subunit epsilon
VHGLTREFLSDKPRFDSVADELLQFVSEAEVIIHNAEFDLKFLDAEFERLGRPAFRQLISSVTDSLLLARELHPGKRNSLDALCDRYGVSNAHRTLHGALLDAELLAEVWLAMTRGQDSLMMDLAAESSRAPVRSVQTATGPALLFEVSEADRQAHESYLDGLDKACKQGSIWRRQVA